MVEFALELEDLVVGEGGARFALLPRLLSAEKGESIPLVGSRRSCEDRRKEKKT